MIERNYNGSGRWTVENVRNRYRDYATRYSVEEQLSLDPQVYESGGVRWVYPIMDAVIAGIERGDAACCALGIEFIEEDRKFPFGANLKSRTARALRRASLSQTQARRVRRRIVNMLIAGNTPREYREYAKLLRKLGIGDFWKDIERGTPKANKYAMRYFRYFKAVHEESPAVIRK